MAAETALAGSRAGVVTITTKRYAKMVTLPNKIALISGLKD
ncbi:MAG: hypothetical protein AB1299_06755 [Thermoproteota archaeon]